MVIAAAGLLPVQSRAAWDAQPYALAEYLYETNVFALSPQAAPALGKDGPTRDDSLLVYGAGLDSKYLFGNQQLQLNARGIRKDYQQLVQLDHDEYLLDGKLLWQLPAALDGELRHRIERRSASILDQNSTALLLQTERLSSATVNVAVASAWRVGGGYAYRTEDSPQPAFPFLSVTERTASALLSYTGNAGWSAGLHAERLSGEFSGITGPFGEPYKQTEIRLTAKYGDELHTLAMELGRTRRDQTTTQDVSTVTGLVAYNRTLTAKTSVSLQYDRGLETNVINANVVVTAGPTAGINWNATEKTSVALSYAWRRSTYVGQPADSGAGDRLDRYQQSVLDVKYQVLDFLLLHPYASYQARQSNVELFHFNDAVIGLKLEARFK